MPGADDPYLLPNSTLRDKLGITGRAELSDAEADLAAVRERLLRARLLSPPFTFDTLKTIRFELIQDVYAWAGQARITPLAKREHDHPASPVQAFAGPDTIAPRARRCSSSLLRKVSLPACRPRRSRQARRRCLWA